MMKKPQKEEYFVEIKDPNEVRRHVLEALKDILEVMHQFEKLRHIRHQKLEAVQKLRASMRGANRMMGSLKLMLPQTSMKPAAVEEHKKKHHSKKKVSHEARPQKREMSELEKLESELNVIEGKLKDLN
ncbi:MAG TPA: hypothetical protein VJI97_04115 [Candidatus Nanoarchaeia archaeon]|nr:hypothetical protein [Candidatus Nanoarchaeia archaeon]